MTGYITDYIIDYIIDRPTAKSRTKSLTAQKASVEKGIFDSEPRDRIKNLSRLTLVRVYFANMYLSGLSNFEISS